jgi:hypothetical protein
LPKPIDQGRVVGSGGAGRHAATAAPLGDWKLFLSCLALPLFGDRLCHPPSREIRETVERSNASVLGFLLQGVDLEAMPRPADERLAEALAPLRIKLDILIDMLGRLSYRDIVLPPVCDVELRPTHIAWRSPQSWQRGDWLRIELYFHPTFREPVTLFAEVTSCVEQGRGEGCRIAADLIATSESTGEKLARLALLTQRHQRARQPVRTAAKSET